MKRTCPLLTVHLTSIALLDAIATASSLTIDTVKSMTLSSYLSRTSRQTHAGEVGASWLTCVGMHGRSRTRYGLQYCPRCLEASGAFVRTWRLAFVFACPVHGLMLGDRCGGCGAPVALHRTRHAPSSCHRCGTALGNLACRDTALLAEALHVQEQFIGFCRQDHIDIVGPKVKTADFFWGLGALMKILREKIRSHPSVFRASNYFVLKSCKPLRLAAAPMRLHLCSSLLDVLEQWPEKFLNVALASNMTRTAFAHCGELPQWLNDQVSQLPQRIRPRYSYRRTTLINNVRLIEADGGMNCRARRAGELMVAARRWL